MKMRYCFLEHKLPEEEQKIRKAEQEIDRLAKAARLDRLKAEIDCLVKDAVTERLAEEDEEEHAT